MRRFRRSGEQKREKRNARHLDSFDSNDSGARERRAYQGTTRIDDCQNAAFCDVVSRMVISW
ncbi:MAG TPA: hypothetical protein VM846_12270 [Vicinamibacterales bacterium]|nr:hypothetical protein [Vicinamibacterales bacterium]